MIECKGEHCNAVDGVGHSPACHRQHTALTTKVPICFDRAEHGGRVFDNCRFINSCNGVKPICGNNPPLPQTKGAQK